MEKGQKPAFPLLTLLPFDLLSKVVDFLDQNERSDVTGSDFQLLRFMIPKLMSDATDNIISRMVPRNEPFVISIGLSKIYKQRKSDINVYDVSYKHLLALTESKELTEGFLSYDLKIGMFNQEKHNVNYINLLVTLFKKIGAKVKTLRIAPSYIAYPFTTDAILKCFPNVEELICHDYSCINTDPNINGIVRDLFNFPKLTSVDISGLKFPEPFILDDQVPIKKLKIIGTKGLDEFFMFAFPNLSHLSIMEDPPSVPMLVPLDDLEHLCVYISDEKIISHEN
jgi:hypothetical protein